MAFKNIPKFNNYSVNENLIVRNNITGRILKYNDNDQVILRDPEYGVKKTYYSKEKLKEVAYGYEKNTLSGFIPIYGIDDYFINEYGIIKFKNGRLKKHKIDYLGYHYIFINGRKYIHNLVYDNYVIEKKYANGKKILFNKSKKVCHKDGNKSNNWLYNLEKI